MTALDPEDFFEEDEPLEDLLREFNAATEGGRTARPIHERFCGCTWQIIPVSELPARVRHPQAGPHAVRYVRQCAEHSVMCRNLEPWEHAILDEVQRP